MLSLLFITTACSNDDDNGYSDNGTTRLVHVKNAGTLPELISEDEMYKIANLKISGVLNGTDIQILRKMAGIDEHGRQTGGILANLDMADAKIVAGGEPYDGYYQTDYDIIGKYMFSDCISLKSIILPNSVTTIKSGAFANCDHLKSVTLPQNIRKLAALFDYYSDYEDYPLVYIFSSTPPELSDYEPNQSGILYVPKGCRKKYINSEWGDIFEIILEEGEVPGSTDKDEGNNDKNENTDENENEYTGNSCYFIFENNGPRSTALASAMNPMSPGIFCRITTSGEDYYTFTSNQGLTDRVVRNAIDKQRTVELGVYNETGIIVGYGNLNNPATFYAYDSQCPNCYKNTNLPRYSLTINSDGTAECGSCHRKYDMNNGGIVSAGYDGDSMMRYRNARTTGPLGVLSVSN